MPARRSVPRPRRGRRPRRRRCTSADLLQGRPPAAVGCGGDALRWRLLASAKGFSITFGPCRLPGGADHVDEGAQRRRNLPVPGIVEKVPSKVGDQSSSTRTSCPERRNGSARASIVYAMPSPSTAARTAKSGSLTITRPSTEICRDLPFRSNGHSNTAPSPPRDIECSCAGRDHRACAAARRRAKYVGAPTTATFIGPITRTAIMSAGARSLGPIPASNPFATRSIGASSTWSSRWTSG